MTLTLEDIKRMRETGVAHGEFNALLDLAEKELLRHVPPKVEAKLFFYGVREKGGAGHDLYKEGYGSSTSNDRLEGARIYPSCDGGFAPGSIIGASQFTRELPEREGDAQLSFVAGFTILSWWDNSGDSRSSSSSTFILEGRFTFEQMLAAATERFPAIVKRQRKPLTLIATHEIELVRDMGGTFIKLRDGKPPICKRCERADCQHWRRR